MLKWRSHAGLIRRINFMGQKELIELREISKTNRKEDGFKLYLKSKFPDIKNVLFWYDGEIIFTYNDERYDLQAVYDCLAKLVEPDEVSYLPYDIYTGHKKT